ncbi:hypothetical protein S7711_03697 [Stachybotrys chartarum IBT 7711]|uniref:Zn(2)-C6 fungal-type domain-containing protein n=1 Tax=Stachybotrys chartarum (strain CBS 109288 / IBT 7711) TaxID=1280523 RepID=A0A084B7K5_STACB|nr:hypothetical protein S7711_03697 [Stachybotrys chartarum IBT 7711]KFA48246.1 hypothetical protein S40293_07380 [Stachybotrys chartarum IBT 40293]
MSSSKKRPAAAAATDENAPDSSISPAPAKKRRVSLACNSCRAAREKCDGRRPHCGTCVANKRTCTYPPASKKRGLKTGYLRTIELSLAWIFDQVPGSEKALRNLLTRNDGRDGAKFLKKEDAAAARLHKRWSKSQVHKDIARLLSDGGPPVPDSSEESDTEGDGGEIPPIDASIVDQLPRTDAVQQAFLTALPISGSTDPTSLRLPSHWRRLLDIYLSYTHCWFPILDHNALVHTASSYNYNAKPKSTLPSCHAELWAALAVASFQDWASSVPYEDASLTPSAIYSIAISLVPDGPLDLAHIRALLLQSLILLGRGRYSEAWLLVARGILALPHVGQRHPGTPAEFDSADDTVSAACFILDTLLALCLGRRPYSRGGSGDETSSAARPDVLTTAVWNPVQGLASSQTEQHSSTPIAQPLFAFQQLYRFSKVLNSSIDGIDACQCNTKTQPGALAKCLDPHFNFCNSLMDSTPAVPSAFLLQSTYLAANVALSPTCRASLLSTLMEAVESCISHFGVGGTCPIISALMAYVQRRGMMEKMHEAESPRWETRLTMLRGVWAPDKMDYGSTALHETPTPASGALWPTPGDLAQGYTLPQVDYPHAPAALQDERLGLALDPTATPLPLGAGDSYPSPAFTRGYPGMSRYSAIEGLQSIDYDAILEDLDCTDGGVDMDLQFMTNLGFAPGCDLGDKVFRESLGLIDDIPASGG